MTQTVNRSSFKVGSFEEVKGEVQADLVDLDTDHGVLLKCREIRDQATVEGIRTWKSSCEQSCGEGKVCLKLFMVPTSYTCCEDQETHELFDRMLSLE
eukprot:Skav236704  [mRNA]  locus=scaffold738:113706:122478:- [translate_table: standard]